MASKPSTSGASPTRKRRSSSSSAPKEYVNPFSPSASEARALARAIVREAARLGPLTKQAAYLMVRAQIPEYLLARWWEWEREISRRWWLKHRKPKHPTGECSYPIERKVDSGARSLSDKTWMDLRRKNTGDPALLANLVDG